MNVSLRQLKGFLLVAQWGSFTRAAEQLHITQAGLSSMMRDLERQFDCRLFDRTTRSVSLTPEGASLVESAALVVERLEDAQRSVKLSTAAARRILTVAVTPVVASALLPSVCRAFEHEQPTVDVRILDVPRGDIQGIVERGEADVGFGIFLKPAVGSELQPLTRFQLLFIAPPATLAAAALRRRSAGLASIAWSRLPGLPWIALPPGTPVQQVVSASLAKAGAVREVRHVCNTMPTILAMVSAGFGATILPSMVLPSCPADRFDVARLASPIGHLPFYALTKKGRQRSPLIAPFTQRMAAEAQRLCSVQPPR